MPQALSTFLLLAGVPPIHPSADKHCPTRLQRRTVAFLFTRVLFCARSDHVGYLLPTSVWFTACSHPVQSPLLLPTNTVAASDQLPVQDTLVCQIPLAGEENHQQEVTSWLWRCSPKAIQHNSYFSFSFAARWTDSTWQPNQNNFKLKGTTKKKECKMGLAVQWSMKTATAPTDCPFSQFLILFSTKASELHLGKTGVFLCQRH